MAISQIAALAAIALGGFLLAVSIGLMLSRYNRVDREKLRLALFDRRWRIYATASNSIGRALEGNGLTAADLREFYRGVAGNEFLFQQDVADFLDELARQLTHLLIEENQVAEEVEAPAKAENAQRRSFALRWLELNEVRLRTLFAPYLDFGKSELSKG